MEVIMEQENSFVPYKRRLLSVDKRTTMLIIAAIVLLSYIPCAVVSIPSGKIGVIFTKIGKDPAIKDRFIVEKGEKGIQREVLMPGWRYFWKADRLWKIDITKYPMVSIPKQSIGLVEALDGEFLPEGQILAKDDHVDEKGVFHMGQKGPRESVLTPGLHPINPKYLMVKKHPAVIIQKGQLGVVTKRVGEIPPDGTVLVSKDDNFKGVQKEVLVPGEYYLNPLAVAIDIIDAVVIPKGQVGIVTKRVGRMPPEGTILVEAEGDYQGIQRVPLQPGIHYINPFDRDVKIIPAVVVPDGHVGVQIAKTGEPKPVDQLLAKPGQRGILEATLSPGLYYINPYEYEVVIFDTRQQRYEMTVQEGIGDTLRSDSIQFLSDDGFEITIDLTVLYQVDPENAPYVVATVGRSVDDVRDKIIRPSARSFARIIGSMNVGEEFVHGSTREAFQNNLHTALEAKCLDSRVKINQAFIRHFEVPIELRDPITKKVIASKLEEQYTQEQKTQMANAELARQTELVVFQAKKVKAETSKMEAKIRAEQQRDVEETLVAKKKFEALGDAEKIKIDADAKLYSAKKEAEGILVQKTAEAEGQKKMVNAWSGDGARYIVAKELASRLANAKIIPLELFFGGSSGTSGGGVIEYRDNLELLKLLKIFDTSKDVKELQKGLQAK
jgi:regulator of protease activity HflC (stomatin/prohibitin superfamily)